MVHKFEYKPWRTGPTPLSLYSISAHKKGNSFGHAMKAYNKKQMATKRYYNKQGKLSGLYQCWYSNGQKEREGVVINGKKWNMALLGNGW